MVSSKLRTAAFHENYVRSRRSDSRLRRQLHGAGRSVRVFPFGVLGFMKITCVYADLMYPSDVCPEGAYDVRFGCEPSRVSVS